MMLQLEQPEDFVIATGETHSVREFVETAFAMVGRQVVWEGSGPEEVGKEADTGIVRVRINSKYFRPTEVVSNVDEAVLVRVKYTGQHLMPSKTSLDN